MLVIILLLALGPGTPLFADDKVWQFGVVPQFDARQIQAIWQPVFSAIEQQSGVRLQLVGSPGIPGFEQQLADGRFDFAYMNPYHLLKAQQDQGYLPLVRDTGKTLFGIIVVRKDSALDEISDLDGQTIAFPAPNALGASLIPRAELSEIYDLEIEPRYVRSHSSVYLNVITGETAAGGGVEKTLKKQPANIRDSLRTIYRTPGVAPHPVSVHPRVPADVRERVLKAFLELGKTPEGRDLLARIPMAQVGRASLSDYDSLKQMDLDKYYVK